MADVISLAEARVARGASISGTAMCLDCSHEWTAVAPHGTTWLECPACHLIRGRFKFHHEREELHWHCNCGNHLFAVVQDGIYCPNCGTWQEVEFNV